MTRRVQWLPLKTFPLNHVREGVDDRLAVVRDASGSRTVSVLPGRSPVRPSWLGEAMCQIPRRLSDRETAVRHDQNVVVPGRCV